MKFLIDAQLPVRLKLWLIDNGYDALHTDDLPHRNLTHDIEIADIAEAQNRIVISKDGDFLKLKILQGKPQKLLLITTGNIRNQDLLKLFERNFAVGLKLFDSYNTVEINNSFIVGHTI